jgi:hypothetical protein
MADNLDPRQIDELISSLNNLTDVLGGETSTVKKQDIKNFEDLGKVVKENMLSYNALTKGISSASKVFGELASGAKGASQYNSAIDSGTNAINRFAGILGTLVGGPLGLFIKAVGLGAAALGKYAQAANKQSDALYKSYQDLNKIGAAGADGMTGVFQSMQKFGYGIEQLGDMTALLKENSVALATFGGTASQGTKAFAEAAGQIQHSEIGKSLQMLGKTPDDINKGIAGFIRTQTQLGQGQKAIQADLVAQSSAYVKNLDLMSRLTGESAEQLQAKLEQANAEDAFNQTQYELKKKAAAGDAAAAQKYAANQELAQRLTGTALKEFQQGVGGDLSSMTKTMMTASGAVQVLGKTSYTADEYINALKDGADKTRQSMGGLAKFNATNDFLLPMKEVSEMQSKYADQTSDQLKERAKAEQDLAAKGLDPATKAATELRISQMNARDNLQSFVNAGVVPATKAMAAMAKVADKVTGVPGAIMPKTFGTTTGTDIGGGAHTRGFPAGGGLPPGSKPPSSSAVQSTLGTTPGLGAVARQFESSKGGAGTVGQVKGDYGGASYGIYQMSSKMGQVQQFLKENEKYGKQFEGLTAGTEDFNKKWKELGGDKGFEEAQQAYAKKQYYDAQVKTLGELGGKLAGKGRGVQEALFSTGVQYGGGSKVIEKALGGKDVDKMSESDIINSIQDYKAQNVSSNFKSSSAEVQASVAKRIERERSALMAQVGPAGGYQNTVASLNPSAQLPQAQGPASTIPGGGNPQETQTSLLAQISDKLDVLNKTSRQNVDVNDKILKRAV